MALIHDQSEVCMKIGLNLFTIENWTNYINWNNPSDTATLMFYISTSGEDYPDLNNTYLFIRVRIVNSDCTWLTMLMWAS